MTRFDAFTWFGSARFSSRRTHHRTYYEQLTDNQGGNYAEAFGSAQGARVFAAARCLASAQYLLDRAANQANPLKVTDLLAEYEVEYGLVPLRSATANERRRELAARVLIMKGATRASVQEALALVLGDDFVAYRTTEAADRAMHPPTLALAMQQGTFKAEGHVRKDIKITQCISVGLGAPQTVTYASYDPTVPAPQLLAGETLLVDPACLRETVTIASAGVGTFTATFTKPHDANVPATTARVPIWWTNQRHALIVLTPTAAKDPEKRRKVSEICRRLFRGVSTWDITDADGPFTVGEGLIGVTPITAI